jgi:hypothetical protein
MTTYRLGSEIVCEDCSERDYRIDCSMVTDKCVCAVTNNKDCKCCRICKYITTLPCILESEADYDFYFRITGCRVPRPVAELKRGEGGDICTKCKNAVIFGYFYHNREPTLEVIDTGTRERRPYYQYPRYSINAAPLTKLHERVVAECQKNIRGSVSDQFSERRESLALKLGRLLTPAEVEELWIHYLTTEN